VTNRSIHLPRREWASQLLPCLLFLTYLKGVELIDMKLAAYVKVVEHIRIRLGTPAGSEKRANYGTYLDRPTEFESSNCRSDSGSDCIQVNVGR